jgi:hypothetical protein
MLDSFLNLLSDLRVPHCINITTYSIRMFHDYIECVLAPYVKCIYVKSIEVILASNSHVMVHQYEHKVNFFPGMCRGYITLTWLHIQLGEKDSQK